MSLLDTVAKLQELEVRMPTLTMADGYLVCTPEDLKKNDALMPGELEEFCVALRNAAPALLQVLRLIHPGDADQLGLMASYFEIPGEGIAADHNKTGLYWASILRRMQGAADLMEG